MESTERAVLEHLVDAYDATGEPQSVTETAEAVGERPGTVATVLLSLEECELVVAVDGGYRPSVTGRELLDLELPDGALVVVDADPEG